MRRALMVVGALAILVLPAEAGAIKLKTNRDRECFPAVLSSMSGGSATYGVRVRNSECEPAIEVVRSVIWLSQHGQIQDGSVQRERGPLNYENVGNQAAAGGGYTTTIDVGFVLRDSNARQPERWRRKTGPSSCTRTSTFRAGDTISCFIVRQVN